MQDLSTATDEQLRSAARATSQASTRLLSEGRSIPSSLRHHEAAVAHEIQRRRSHGVTDVTAAFAAAIDTDRINQLSEAELDAALRALGGTQ